MKQAGDAPVLTSTIPATVGNTRKPLVKGTAPTGSTVRLYSDDACAGPVVGTGSAGDLASYGIALTVDDAENATTRLFAQAADPSQNGSLCSTIDFVHDSTGPVPPGGLSTSPVSPSQSGTPYVRGTSAETGSTVAISRECNTDAGKLLAMGAAADFLTTGVLVDGGLATNTLYVMSIDPAQNRSSCATVSYITAHK